MSLAKEDLELHSQPKFADATLAGYSRPEVVTGALTRFPLAMREIARISTLGCEKHKVPKGDMTFLEVPDAYRFYTDKVGRHLIDEALQGPMQNDPALPGCTHAGSLAWNALARLEVLLRKLEKESQ